MRKTKNYMCLMKYIKEEMDSRASIVGSGAEATIRYDSFKTDSRYGLLIVTFRNIY